MIFPWFWLIFDGFLGQVAWAIGHLTGGNAGPDPSYCAAFPSFLILLLKTWKLQYYFKVTWFHIKINRASPGFCSSCFFSKEQNSQPHPPHPPHSTTSHVMSKLPGTQLLCEPRDQLQCLLERPECDAKCQRTRCRRRRCRRGRGHVARCCPRPPQRQEVRGVAAGQGWWRRHPRLHSFGGDLVGFELGLHGFFLGSNN